MKAYLITVLALDFENYGPDSAIMEISNVRGICCIPVECTEREIGKWSDEHPLNHKGRCEAEIKRLFGFEAAAAKQQGVRDE